VIILNEKYSVYGEFTANEGKELQLHRLLLETANEINDMEDCLCYIVSKCKKEQNKIYVFEIWENKIAHETFMELEVMRNFIRRIATMISKMNSNSGFVLYDGDN